MSMGASRVLIPDTKKTVLNSLNTTTFKGN